MLTLTDLFAGAGGSSTGAFQVPGVHVDIAANHNALVTEIHAANHQTTDHAVVDLHQERPSFFPKTDILWASPECTKWSQASGQRGPAIEEGLYEDPLSDDAKTRSRLLMFDVLKFIEYHRYRLVFVENVVDIATQSQYRLAWKVWRDELTALGYAFRVISLNSMHAQTYGLPAPQSRDRIYVVAWPIEEKAPDLDRILRPKAWCPRCEVVAESVQAFKPGRTVGRYRQAYVYLCRTCNKPVEPAWLPAAAAIDWSIEGQRIGDRDRPLAPKTIKRIAAGIARYWGPLAVPVEGRDGKDALPLDIPMRTQTTRQETALVVNHMSGDDASRSRPATEPMHTVVASGNHAGLIETPFLTQFRERTRDLDPARETLPTIVADGANHALIMTNQRNNRARPTDEELPTLTTATGGGQALMQTELPFFAELRGGSSDARSVGEPQSTITAGGNHHALITRHYGIRGGDPARHTTTPDEYLRTLTGNGGNMSLVQRHNDGGAEMLTPVDEYLRTITTKGHQSLLQSKQKVTAADLDAAMEIVPDVLFRMLQPHEIAAGMAFPADYNWQPPDRLKPISARDLVKAAGNAVTPPAARDLIAAAIASLGYETEAAA